MVRLTTNSAATPARAVGYRLRRKAGLPIGALCGALLLLHSPVWAQDHGASEDTDLVTAPWAARYQDGTVTMAEWDDWQRYLEISKRRLKCRVALEDLIMTRILAGRTQSEALDPAELQRRSARHARQRSVLARAKVERALADAIEITRAEVKAAYTADPKRYQRSERLRLANLFLRVPDTATAEERAASRQRLEALRERLRAGEPFADLARQHSESQTRLRGGDMGYVALERLDPAVRAAVAELEPGEFSSILRTGDGLSVVQVNERRPAVDQSLEDARASIEQRLKRTRYQADVEAMEASLRQRVEVNLETAARWADPNAVVAVFRLAQTRHPVTVAALRGDLEQRGRPTSTPSALNATQRQAALDALALDWAYQQEADHRGLLADETSQRELRYRALELDAQMAANAYGEGKLELPKPEVLAARYTQREKPMMTTEAWHLRSLSVPITPSMTRARLNELRRWGDRLVVDGGVFDQLAAKLGPEVEAKDHSWLNHDQVWLFGLNADHAIRALSPGDWSNWVQQGRRMYLFELVAKREPRALSFEEARPHLEGAILHAQRRRLGNTLRKEILQQQAIEVLVCSSDS